MTFIVKATSKGQITLPVKWRKSFRTNRFLLKEKKGLLEISPLCSSALEEEEGWETIFDADRDNNGKGIKIETFLKTLRKTL